MTEHSNSKKAFVDTAPFIYFFEGDSDLSLKSRDIFLRLINDNYEINTSYISEVEMKVLPQRNKQARKLIIMDSFIVEFGINKLDIGVREYKTALDIRANYTFIKLIDAFQLAIALNNKCEYFITNDKDLKKYDQIKVLLVDEFEKIISHKANLG